MSKIKRLLIEKLESINEKKHSYDNRNDAIKAYFKDEVSAKELVKIAMDNFGVAVGTKKEFDSILNNSFMLGMAVDQYGIDKKKLIAKIKELVKLI